MGPEHATIESTMKYEKRPRSVWWLVLGITSFSVFAWFINSFEPISASKLVIFFVLICISSFWTLLYLLNNVRRSVLLSLGVTTYLLLRFFNLRESLYGILLLAFLASLELLLAKR